MKTVVATMLLLTVVASALRAQQQGPRNSYWEIIAKVSDIHIIKSADLKGHILDMEDKVKNRNYYYQLPIVETLKGEITGSIKIMIFLEQDFIDFIKMLPDDTDLITFIYSLYDEHRDFDSDEFNNFFLNTSTKGIVVYTAEIYREIVDEIRNQQIILNERLYESFLRDEAIDRKIKGLIDELVIPEREISAFDELLKIGKEAVPYIILHMDDYRELPIKYVRVKIDDPDAWEGLVHYGPKLVIDMLAILSIELARISFGPIWNGGTNEERQRTLNGWRIYLYYHYVGT